MHVSTPNIARDSYTRRSEHTNRGCATLTRWGVSPLFLSCVWCCVSLPMYSRSRPSHTTQRFWPCLLLNQVAVSFLLPWSAFAHIGNHYLLYGGPRQSKDFERINKALSVSFLQREDSHQVKKHLSNGLSLIVKWDATQRGQMCGLEL